MEELSSEAAVEEAPEHELEDEVDGERRLIVRLPRVSAVTDLDVQIGRQAVRLHAEGLYLLELDLPDAVDSDNARCKWEKKKRVLTVVMPLASL